LATVNHGMHHDVHNLTFRPPLCHTGAAVDATAAASCTPLSHHHMALDQPKCTTTAVLHSTSQHFHFHVLLASSHACTYYSPTVFQCEGIVRTHHSTAISLQKMARPP
uniref:Secreted protein n=1 Tax=Hydatigena taeniaeformis TaxID=6205 RepID=A0A0R3WPH7_HYDTA